MSSIKTRPLPGSRPKLKDVIGYSYNDNLPFINIWVIDLPHPEAGRPCAGWKVFCSVYYHNTDYETWVKRALAWPALREGSFNGPNRPRPFAVGDRVRIWDPEFTDATGQTYTAHRFHLEWGVIEELTDNQVGDDRLYQVKLVDKERSDSFWGRQLQHRYAFPYYDGL